MQAQGPIIKGMNHAVTAGALAAEAFADARARGDPSQAGKLYEKKLHDEGVMDSSGRPGRVFGQLGELGPVDNLSTLSRSPPSAGSGSARQPDCSNGPTRHRGRCR